METMQNKTKVILSLKMAGYLAFCGNLLLETKDDLKGSKRKVFIFANTTKLENDMANYSKFLEMVK